MILSNVEIQQALDDGDLIIDPVPSPRRPTADAECPYNTTAVDLRLGPTLSIPEKAMPFAFDLRKGGISGLLSKVYRTHPIDPVGGYSLQPRQFVLGGTLEGVGLPIQAARRCLAARIEGKSSLARCGLIVHLTAPTIHAGFEAPTIALEMTNLGENAIVLFPGMPIAQLIIEVVSGIPFQNLSQFQKQSA